MRSGKSSDRCDWVYGYVRKFVELLGAKEPFTASNRGEVVKSIESEGQEEYGGGGGGGEAPESDGLGFPKMAERIEYSRLAASEPNEKVGSNEVPSRESGCVKFSAGAAGGAEAAGCSVIVCVPSMELATDLLRLRASNSSSSSRYLAFLR